MVHEAWSLIEQKEPDFFMGAKSPYYSSAFNIRCPNADGVFEKGCPMVLLQFTKKDIPKPQVRLEFNPLKIFGSSNNLPPAMNCEPAKEHLDFMFTGLCGMEFFQFLSHARVTRLDICRHILFRSPEDYLFGVKYAKSVQSVFGGNGKLETLYFGKGTGNQTIVYNKSKHLHGDAAAWDTVRIEARLKMKKTKISDLWGIPNPLNKVRPHSLKHHKPPCGPAHWIAFQDACRYRGISNAIKCQPSKCHYRLKKALSEQPVTWWEMDDYSWTRMWHEALEDSWLNRICAAPPLYMKFLAGE